MKHPIHIRFDSRFNNDWNSNKQIVNFRGTCGSSSYGLDASYERPADVSTYSIAASKDDIRTHGFHIETGHHRQDYHAGFCPLLSMKFKIDITYSFLIYFHVHARTKMIFFIIPFMFQFSTKCIESRPWSSDGNH
jgi:hypothetical protein